jgi:transposase-like protein
MVNQLSGENDIAQPTGFLAQLTYTYEARKPGVKEQITVMAFNGAGVRDTARTLKVGINTVIRTLKNSHYDE